MVSKYDVQFLVHSERLKPHNIFFYYFSETCISSKQCFIEKFSFYLTENTVHLIIKINLLMVMYREVIAFCREDHKKHTYLFIVRAFA